MSEVLYLHKTFTDGDQYIHIDVNMLDVILSYGIPLVFVAIDT